MVSETRLPKYTCKTNHYKYSLILEYWYKQFATDKKQLKVHKKLFKIMLKTYCTLVRKNTIFSIFININLHLFSFLYKKMLTIGYMFTNLKTAKPINSVQILFHTTYPQISPQWTFEKKLLNIPSDSHENWC